MGEFFMDTGGPNGCSGKPKPGKEGLEGLGEGAIKTMNLLLGVKGANSKEVFEAIYANKTKAGLIFLTTLKVVAEHILVLSQEKCRDCVLKKGTCKILHTLGNVQDVCGFLVLKIDEMKDKKMKEEEGSTDIKKMLGELLNDFLGGKKDED